MTPCRLVHYSVPDGPPYYVNGTSHVVTKCHTHNVAMNIADHELCPIGLIERATEEAIAKIKEAHQCP